MRTARARGVEISTYGPYLQQVKLLCESVLGRYDGSVCSHVETCSRSFSLIRLRCGGLEWPWVRGPLPMGTEMCV